MDLLTRSTTNVRSISGPLLFLEDASGIRVGEWVRIATRSGERRGRVIEVERSRAVVQLLEEPEGLSPAGIEVAFRGEATSFGVSRDLLGRVFDGAGRPRDGLPAPIADEIVPVAGLPLNVVARENPSELIETGVSAIDGLNPLVRGQKLPVFSLAGLPAAELAARIVRDSRVAGGEEFAVVFAAFGIPQREASFYLDSLRATGALSRTAVFLSLAGDPAIERLLTPRFALTAAEHLAFTHGLHVLVVLTDMTWYCEALRELALAREELPGRRGYPGYMYTDLASIYERAGRVKGRAGSVTQLPIVTLPDDDITHPIPDLTGYITEGQIVLSRELFRKGVSPPIDVLPSLSRLMSRGIGPGRTRADHRAVADQLYALYAKGVDLRRIAAIVGSGGLSDEDRAWLAFADRFEQDFVGQGDARRTVVETLEKAWELFAPFASSPSALTRIPKAILEARKTAHAA